VTLVGNDPSYFETTKFGIEKSDTVTAVSESLRQATIDQLHLDGKAIEVIPNFIDPARSAKVRGQPGAKRWAKPGEKILIHVSNFRPVKRVMDVLDVFLGVRDKMSARLLLVGDGPDRARLEERCRKLCCCDSVTFLGNIAAVEEVLTGADLFLLPSESESFGLAALEALACEVPVIASRAGGIPEVVRHGVDGLLYPVGDIGAMAAGARELLSDPERHARFARAAREGAIERFAEAKVVARYRELYERTLDGDRRALASRASAAGVAG
jgi:L-malate glycosyltransferase